VNIRAISFRAQTHRGSRLLDTLYPKHELCRLRVQATYSAHPNSGEFGYLLVRTALLAKTLRRILTHFSQFVPVQEKKGELTPPTEFNCCPISATADECLY
jgi:hypothetical protein